MSTKYRFTDSDIPHFITMTLVEWIDLFSRERYKEIIIENLKFCVQRKGLIIHAYVIMSNHIHMILRTSPNKKLAAMIRDFKRYTAKILYETLKADEVESRKNWMIWIIESQGRKSSANETSKVWIHENHPIPLETNQMVESRINYIHQNPVRAGICYTAEDYQYSSAGIYAGETGVMDVELLR